MVMIVESTIFPLSPQNSIPIIISGDWNCTFSKLPTNLNPDVLNMVNLPNLRHTQLLLNLCNDLELSDPFRTKFPNRKEFSYVPSDLTKKNRSRIDFFIVSNSLLHNITDCGVNPGLQNKMFDHKAVFLSTIPKKSTSPTIPTISHKILLDPDLDYVVALAVAETYLSCTSCPRQGGWGDLLLELGQAKNKLRRAAPSSVHMSPGDRSEFEELTREGLIAEVREFLDEFPYPLLRDGPLAADLDPDFFMEGLMNNVRNEVISHQNFVLKKQKPTEWKF
jgi:hypothetical protein